MLPAEQECAGKGDANGTIDAKQKDCVRGQADPQNWREVDLIALSALRNTKRRTAIFRGISCGFTIIFY